MPVCVFSAVTCTFGMRAPAGSRTVPDNVAFVLCAEVDTAINRNRTPHHLFISCSSTDEADSIKRKFLSLLKPIARPSDAHRQKILTRHHFMLDSAVSPPLSTPLKPEVKREFKSSGSG